MSNKYVEQILTAMEIISNAQINQSQRDITIQAKIKSKTKNDEVYSIEYQGAEYQGVSGGKDYSVEDIVFVTCPNGISGEEKIIIGKKSVQEELIEDILDQNNDYINVGSNIIKDDGSFDTELLQGLLPKIDGIRLSAEFTATPENINEGLNYGIKLTFDNNKTFVLDINDMIGYPYYYPTATTQEKIILKDQIDDSKTITSCEFFIDPEGAANITANNISIFAIIERNKITQDEVLVINRSNTHTLENNESQIRLEAFLISKDEGKMGAYSWEVKSKDSEEWVTLSDQTSQTIDLSPTTVWAKNYQIRGVVTIGEEEIIYSEQIDIVNKLGLTVNVSREENTLVIDSWDQYTGVEAYLWQVKDVHGQIMPDKERKFRTYPIDPTIIEISNEYIGSAFINGVYIGSDSEFVTQVIPSAKIYSMSLSNDREMVAITSSGKPLSGADGIIASTVASVWEDNTQITDANITLTAPDSFYNGEGDNKVLNSELIVFNGGKFQLKGFPNESVDSYTFIFKYQISEGNILQEDFVVKKFASEEDYSLQVATPVVNLTNLTTSSPTGTIMFYITRRNTNGLTKLLYGDSSYSVSANDKNDGSIAIEGDSSSIEHKISYNKDTAFPLTITLTVNGIVWDEEEIEAVKNGSNGNDGDTVKTISAYILTKDKSPSPLKPSGSDLGNWNLNYQTPTKDNRYLWRSDCEVVNGNYGNWSDPILVEEYSLKVTKVEEKREETVYYYSTISLDTPTIKIDATSGNISDDSNDSPNWTDVIPDDNGTFILWKAIRLKVTPITYFEDESSITGIPIYSLLSGPTRYGKLGDAIEGFNTVTNNGTVQGGFYGLNVGVTPNNTAEVIKENDTYLATSVISLTAEDLVKQKIYVIYDSDKKEINKVTEGTANALPVVFELTDYDYYVNASMIKTGILDANLIDVVNLQAQKLLVKDSEGKTLLDAGASSSTSVLIGGFTVEKDRLSGSTISGSTFEAGKAAGIRSDDNKQKDSLVISGKTSPVRFWSGESDNDYTFVVLADGSLYATAAQFTGANITIDDDVKLGDQTVGEVKQDVSTANDRADNAVTIAGDAKTAAITAQNSATASATAAAGSASAAAESEGEAAKSAIDAGTAKTGAEAAQGKAEAARDAAIEAKNTATDSNTSATAIANQASKDVENLRTDVKELQDAGYQTKTDVETAINNSGHATKSEVDALKQENTELKTQVEQLRTELNNRPTQTQVEQMIQDALNNSGGESGGGESGDDTNTGGTATNGTFTPTVEGEERDSTQIDVNMNYLLENGQANVGNTTITATGDEYGANFPIKVDSEGSEIYSIIIYGCLIDVDQNTIADAYYYGDYYPASVSVAINGDSENIESASWDRVTMETISGVQCAKYLFEIENYNTEVQSAQVQDPGIITAGDYRFSLKVQKIQIITSQQ